VRENGGQYTHAAVWAAMAFAALGDARRAWELLALINPANHTRTPSGAATYKTEPYAVAADIYSLAPHTGRGGWTWYTGSAGWLYRLVVESLLGMNLEPGKLRFAPCLPQEWKTFSMSYRYRDTTYAIIVLQVAADRAATADGITVTLDGIRQIDNSIALTNDGRAHAVELTINYISKRVD